MSEASSMRGKRSSGEAGFSLIELMITVAIIGILAMIAVPQFSDYLTQTRRSDANAALLRLAEQQERYYIQNNTYSTDLTKLGVAATTPEGQYTLSVTQADASTFALQAVPATTGQQTADINCLVIKLNSAGLQEPAECW